MLLIKFGSVTMLKKSTIKQITFISGINDRLAKLIMLHIHSKI